MESYIIFLWSTLVAVQAEYCGKLGEKEFYCEEGHCCGDFKCCTYYHYYEMWWFWLLMVIILVLGCTCVYYKRNYIGPYSRMSNYWYAMVQPTQRRTRNQPDVHPFKLPSYEEVIQMSQLGPPEDNEGAPPPYTDFTEQQSINCEDVAENLQLLHEPGVQPTPEYSPPEYTSTIVSQSNA